jgi:hypothetical protein
MFQRKMSFPSSGLKSGFACCRLYCGFLLGLLLKDEDRGSSETSVNFERTIRRYVQEDKNLRFGVV